LLGDVVKPTLGPVHLALDPGPLRSAPVNLGSTSLGAKTEPDTNQHADERQDHY
jgi:hypothetical protein